MGVPKVIDVGRVVHLHHGPHVRRDRLDGHGGQDRAHVGFVGRIDRDHQGGCGLGNPRGLPVLLAGDIAAHVVDAISCGAPLGVVEQDDLGAVLIGLELADHLAGGGVPAADDDMLTEAGGSHSLALLQQKVDDEPHDRAGDGTDDGDPEQDEQPRDQEPARRRHVRAVALAQDGGQRPIEGLAKSSKGLGLLEHGDRQGGDGHETDEAAGQRHEEMAIHRAGHPVRVEPQPPEQRDVEEGFQPGGHGRAIVSCPIRNLGLEGQVGCTIGLLSSAVTEVPMARVVRAALLQAEWTGDKDSMIEKHITYAREAAKQGAKVMCFQELFYGPYFSQVQDPQYYSYTEKIPDGPTTKRMQELAKETGMVLVVPMYEEDEHTSGIYYNTAAVIDDDGSYLDN